MFTLKFNDVGTIFLLLTFRTKHVVYYMYLYVNTLLIKINYSYQLLNVIISFN